MQDVQNRLESLILTANELWQAYLKKGPGQLSPEDYAPLATARRRFLDMCPFDLANVPAKKPAEKWWCEVAQEIDIVDKLLRRCVERSEGLSFVTGEAGLIPRRDLHAQCERALARLRQMSRDLTNSDS